MRYVSYYLQLWFAQLLYSRSAYFFNTDSCPLCPHSKGEE